MERAVDVLHDRRHGLRHRLGGRRPATPRALALPHRLRRAQPHRPREPRPLLGLGAAAGRGTLGRVPQGRRRPNHHRVRRLPLRRANHGRPHSVALRRRGQREPSAVARGLVVLGLQRRLHRRHHRPRLRATSDRAARATTAGSASRCSARRCSSASASARCSWPRRGRCLQSTPRTSPR